jgi:hypothetical protein
MSTKVSNQNVVNMFATLNRMKAGGDNKNANNSNNENDENRIRAGKWHRNQLIFGEELNTYIPFETNIQREIMVRDPYAGVKVLVSHVTTYIYGEPKFVDHVVGVYKELKSERKRAGYVGMRGKNMKGLIAAILYLVMLYEEKSRLSIRELIKAVNHVRTDTTVVVTEKMISQYIIFVKNNLKSFQNKNNNNNTTNVLLKPVNENIKRLSILLGYSIKSRIDVQKLALRLPEVMLETHMPNTIATGLVYVYATSDLGGAMPEDYRTQKELMARMNVTRYAMKKISTKMIPHLKK